jgi:lysophospholipase L1-like esterase
MSFQRYVAIGDSTTEGLDDPYPEGGGYRGWADRLAGRLAELEPGVAYANLTIRGRLAAQVQAEQLEPALALEPDLFTVVAGLNDALRRGFDLAATAGHLDTMLTWLRATGATVLTFTFPDPAPAAPAPRRRGRAGPVGPLLRPVADPPRPRALLRRRRHGQATRPRALPHGVSTSLPAVARERMSSCARRASASG